MFIQKKKNRSGSTSVHILQKVMGRNRIVKSLGFSFEKDEIESKLHQARELLPRLFDQMTIFDEPAAEYQYRNFLSKNGPEIVFGGIFDHLGFDAIPNQLFKDLVISELFYPGSKKRLLDYLHDHNRQEVSLENIFHFLDKLQSQYKHQTEEICFTYYEKLVRNKTGNESYRIIPLHFDKKLAKGPRKKETGKSKKQNFRVMHLGVLTGKNGFPIAYDLFEETPDAKCLLETLEKYEKRFMISLPVIIAPSGLLSKVTMEALVEKEIPFISGVRLKRENEKIRQEIEQLTIIEGQVAKFKKQDKTKLLVHYSMIQAKKDSTAREKKLKRLEKRLDEGLVSMHSINRRGFNRYLKLEKDNSVSIDYKKIASERKWDGLTAYVTNTQFPSARIPGIGPELKQMWETFRIERSDLKIKPGYQKVKERIEAMNNISFVSYALLKELEHILHKRAPEISIQKAIKQINGIKEIPHSLPKGHTQNQKMKTNEIQRKILTWVKY